MSRLTDLQFMVGKNEKILWQGKPKMSCFILESIFNPMLPFALIWGGIDVVLMGVTSVSLVQQGQGIISLGIIAFLLIHMAPVWIYLGGIILCVRKYQNTEYIITDRGVYISGGVFSYSYEMKSFMEMSHVNIHRGILDQMLGVGDVVLTCNHPTMNASGNTGTFSVNYVKVSGHNHSSHNFSICDIPDYQQVFSMLRDLQADIYSDTMYPNDLRPETNHGYQTRYMGGNFGRQDNRADFFKGQDDRDKFFDQQGENDNFFGEQNNSENFFDKQNDNADFFGGQNNQADFFDGQGNADRR